MHCSANADSYLIDQEIEGIFHVACHLKQFRIVIDSIVPQS